MSRISFAIRFALVGVIAWGAVVYVTSQRPGSWHTIFNSCPAGEAVSYIGASQDGAILFRSASGCLELWTTK